MLCLLAQKSTSPLVGIQKFWELVEIVKSLEQTVNLLPLEGLCLPGHSSVLAELAAVGATFLLPGVGSILVA